MDWRQRAVDHGRCSLWVTTAFAILTLAQTTHAQTTPTGTPVTFEMRPGDTLWDLAKNHLDLPSRWQDIIETNDVVNPARLRPGAKVIINEEWFKTSEMPVNVTDLSGIVELSDASGTQTLKLGAISAPEKSQIKCGPTGRTTLTFGNGSIITLEPGSELTLDRVRYLGNGLIPDIAVSLKSGNALVTFPEEGLNRGRLDLKTRAATTSVRGTQFRMAFDAVTEQARSETLRGRIAFGIDTVQVSVAENFGSINEIDAPPLEPIPLLPPPEPLNWPKVIEELPFDLELSPVSGAANYRFALHPKDQPLRVLRAQLRAEPELELSQLTDGEYTVLARSIDALGLEGLDTQETIKIDALPRKPLPALPIERDDTYPKKQGRIIDPQPEFRWRVDQSRLSYRFELAKDGNFELPVHAANDLISATYPLPITLDPGEYNWRVRSTDQTGDTGAFSPIQTFRYAPRPGTVEATLVGGDDGQLTASWNGLQGVQRYRVELSDHQEFERILRSIVIDAAELTQENQFERQIGKPLPNENWLRVIAIDGDGIEGEASNISLFESAPLPWWQSIGIPAAAAVLLLLLI